MAPSIRFSASFILASIVLALLLLSTSAAVTSNKDEKQAEYLAERDLQSAIPDARELAVGGEAQLLALTQDIIKAQASAGFKFCSVTGYGRASKQSDCPPSLPPFPSTSSWSPTTPVVLPFANPANGFQQCWGAKPAPWQCGQTNALGGGYGTYPSPYVGSYIEFPSGYLPALQADTKSAAARDVIIAVMEEFVYNVVTNMLGLGTSMNARCGFPNSMVFGCPPAQHRNNPQLNFGVAPDGRVRLLIIFMVDWNVIISKGRIKTFPQYESTVRGFFSASTVAKLWDAALRSKGAGSSQFLKGGSRRALEGEEEGGQEGGEKDGSLRKLPAVARPPPKVKGTGVVKVVAVGGTK